MRPNAKELRCIEIANQYHKEKGRANEPGVLGYEVSESKKFAQLWSDFGLPYIKGYYQDDLKLTCMQQWVDVLYPMPIILEEIKVEILQRSVERRKAFYAEHPNGHIRILEPIEILPTEIDRRFGDYCGSNEQE